MIVILEKLENFGQAVKEENQANQAKLWYHCQPLLTHTECKRMRPKNCAL